MKKLFIIIFAIMLGTMAFANDQEFDQLTENDQSQIECDQVDETVNDDQVDANVGDNKVSTYGESEPNVAPFGLLSMLSSDTSEQDIAAREENEEKIVSHLLKKRIVPVDGHTKFLKKHFVYQQIDICALLGSDNDPDKDKAEATFEEKTKQDGDNVLNKKERINYGLNFCYSLIFVPGRISDINQQELIINKLGFAYSFGAIVSFDNQSDYGITCDFLGKFGLETGNGKLVSLGADLMFGGGKSIGDRVDLSDILDVNNNPEDQTVTNEPEPDFELEHYSAWCLKYGFQIWLKFNFLASSMNNLNTSIFARYVRSINPFNDEKLLDDYLILNLFNEESWQFGIMLSYRF